MYLAYYGLKREAFHTTPDPSFLYMSSSHKEALGAIVYGIEKRKGFIEITGEVGVGKTTIIRAFLEEHKDPKQKTVYIFNPVLTYHALLTAIFKALDLTPVHDEESEMVNQLHEALIEEYKAGGTVILIVDEAQNMPTETLENLRMLSNLETSTDKLIQVVLVGQPELETLLEQPELRQFQQRIALRAKICPLTEKESRAFILHRIAVASTPRNPVFTNKALQLIARKGRGIPRRLNILCDNALITGFGRQLTPVPASVVNEVLVDIDGVHSPNVPWKWTLVAGIILFLGIGLVAFWAPLNLLENSDALLAVIKKDHDNLDQNRDSSLKIGRAAMQQSERITPLGASRDDIAVHTPSLEDLNTNREYKKPKVISTMKSPKNQTLALKQSSVEESRSTLSRNRREVNAPRSENIPVNPAEQRGSASSQRKIIKAQSRHNPLQIEDDLTRQSKKSRRGSTQSKFVAPSNSNSTMTRVVRNGESLSRIASETYGSMKREYIEWVRRHNPHIVNPNKILPGQLILLPKYPKDVVSP